MMDPRNYASVVRTYISSYIIQRCFVDNLPTDEAPHVLLSCGEMLQGSVETMYQASAEVYHG
jgi:hypothetical protein